MEEKKMATNIYLNEKVKKLQNFWNCIQFHPTDAIEDDWGQRILDRIAEDQSVEMVRIYTMMEDIVTMDENGNLQYDFALNDLRLDYMIEKGFDILLDYNFIPPCIAEKPDVRSCVSKNKTRYKGKLIVTSAPKDYALWEEICYQYTKHIVERYGEERVASWYLHCFNEPDIPEFFLSDLGRSDEDVAIRCREYCKLYKGFANGIRKASTKLHLGGPTLAHSLVFLEDFLNYVKENDLQLDFVCGHSYGTHPRDLNSGAKSINTMNNIEIIANIRNVVDRVFPNKELVIDEWGAACCGFHNREECPKLMYRESEIMAVYFGKMVTELVEYDMNLSKLMICLSGQHEMVEDFSGFRNLFTLNHIAKPIYNAYRLMRRLGSDQLRSETDNANLKVLATSSGDKHAVLLTYAAKKLQEDVLPTVEETIQLHGLEAGKKVTVYRIDADHLNPYNLFLKNGYTKDLTPEQLAILKEEGNLKSAEELTTDGEIKLSIPNNSFILLEV